MNWSVIVQDVEPHALKKTLSEAIGKDKFAKVPNKHLSFAVNQALAALGAATRANGITVDAVSVGLWDDDDNAVHVEVTLKRSVTLPA